MEWGDLKKPRNLWPEKGETKISRPTNIRRPRRFVPDPGDNKNFTWVVIEAYQLLGQSTLMRGHDPVNYDREIEAKFTFLAPESWPEDVTHSWESYESLASKLLQKQAELGKSWETAKSAIKGIKQALSTGWEITEKQKRIKVTDEINRIVSKAGSARAFQYRIDTPLTYQGSERRKYILTFNLIDEGDPEGDILYPIRYLQVLSCPEKVGTTIGIKLPHIFKVYTSPNELLHIRYAALEKVTSTYFGPWMEGYPMRAELQLEFTDLEPLYKDSYNDLPQVTTSSTVGTTYFQDRIKNRAVSEVYSRSRRGLRELTRGG